MIPEKWEFPGGKLEVGQDIRTALEREVLGETGLKIVPVSRIAYTDSRIDTKGTYKGSLYVLLVGVARVKSGEVRLSSEHSEFRWMKLEDLEDEDLTPDARAALVSLRGQLEQDQSIA